jgi:hypothetical protein
LLWTGGLWQNLGALLAGSGHRNDQATRLATAYIEMSETYGWILFDAGHHPQAQRVYQAGISLAREAVHHPTRTAPQPTSSPPPLTRKPGWDIAKKPKQCSTSRPTERNVTQHRACSRSSPTDESPWLVPNTGQAWLTADRIDQAERHLARHLTLGGEHHRDHALLASELAHTRLRTGDVIGACTAARSVLDSMDQTASPRVRGRLDAAIITLRQRYPTHPRVAALPAV